MSTISLVTGGNRGIGLEVCRQLAERGHTVLLTARSAGAAAAAARAAGAEPLQLDVTDPASIAAAARQVAERYGKLDVLVNNAAITYDTWQRAVDADLAVVREAAETNLYGPWLMIQSSCRCCGPASIPGSSTSPARPPRWPAWAAGPRPTPRRRSPSTPSPACSPPNSAATTSWSTRSAPAGSPPTWAARAAARGRGRGQRRLGRDPARLRPHRRLLPRRQAPPVVAPLPAADHACPLRNLLTSPAPQTPVLGLRAQGATVTM